MEEWGFLSRGQSLIHDRDGKYSPAFQRIIDAIGVTCVLLPPRSPNVNAYAEQWVRSVQEAALAHLMLVGERALWRALTEYKIHYHQERSHQSKGHGALMLVSHHSQERQGTVRCREQLGGLLKYYDRQAV
jgi:transposase InsO family protein